MVRLAPRLLRAVLTAFGLVGLGGEGGVDHLDFVGGRRVVGVDLRGLGVGVTEELLQRAQRDFAGGGQLGGEGVAEVVEADGSYAGVAAGGLEALGDFAAVERVAGLRVGEDEVIVAVVDGPSRPVVEGGEECAGAVSDGS
jgi:hypothetical protein